MRSESDYATIVIPNWNGMKWLQICLPALERQTWQDFEVLIVDNGSDDGSINYIESMHPSMRLIKVPENIGFAKASNIGIRSSYAKYIILLNNDTEASENWLEALVKTMEAEPKKVGCVASKMLQHLNPDLIDDAGDILTWRGGAFKRGHGEPAIKYKQQEEVMFPCAGAAIYRRHILEKLGGFDEKFYMYLEDVDLGLRIRLLGYKCLFAPEAEITHVGHGSNIDRHRYIFYTTRNRMMIFLKNVPLSLLIWKAPALIYGWFFFWIVHRGHVCYLRGSLAAVKNLSHIFKEKKKISSLAFLSTTQIKLLISKAWPEIPLTKLLKNTLFGH